MVTLRIRYAPVLGNPLSRMVDKSSLAIRVVLFAIFAWLRGRFEIHPFVSRAARFKAAQKAETLAERTRRSRHSPDQRASVTSRAGGDLSGLRGSRPWSARRAV